MSKLESLRPLGLMLLRWGLGIVFVYHGWPKLFGENAKFVSSFASLGLPSWAVYLAGAIELFGGALLFVGLFTRIAGLLLFAHMSVAMWKYNLAEGWLAVRDYELPLVLGLAALALATIGAGKLSLDYAIFREKA
jgi:putative oxidoreductase